MLMRALKWSAAPPVLSAVLIGLGVLLSDAGAVGALCVLTSLGFFLLNAPGLVALKCVAPSLVEYSMGPALYLSLMLGSWAVAYFPFSLALAWFFNRPNGPNRHSQSSQSSQSSRS